MLRVHGAQLSSDCCIYFCVTKGEALIAACTMPKYSQFSDNTNTTRIRTTYVCLCLRDFVSLSQNLYLKQIIMVHGSTVGTDPSFKQQN